MPRALASRYLAIQGLQQIALRFRAGLKRPQLHIVLVRGLGLLLELVEGDELRGDARVGKLGVVLERAREDSASYLICWSRSPICARNSLMRGWLPRIEEDCSASWARKVTRCSDSRRINSELSTSEEFHRLAGLEHVADEPGFGFRVGFLCARGSKLRIEIAELLHRESWCCSGRPLGLSARGTPRPSLRRRRPSCAGSRFRRTATGRTLRA